MKLSSQLLEVRELKLEVLLVRDGPQAGTLAFDALGNASLNGFGLVTFDGSLVWVLMPMKHYLTPILSMKMSVV